MRCFFKGWDDGDEMKVVIFDRSNQLPGERFWSLTLFLLKMIGQKARFVTDVMGRCQA